MKNILLLMMLFTVSFYAQRTKSKSFFLQKKKDATLVEIKEPKTFFIHSFSKKDPKLKFYKDRGAIGRYSTNYKKGNISIDFSYPDYISSLEIINKPVSVTIKEVKDDKGNLSKTIIFVSNIYAKQYITDRVKGLMFTQQVELKNPDLKYPIDNSKYQYRSFRGIDYLKTTMIAKNVADINIKAYVRKDKNGNYTASKSYRQKVNLVQINKLNKLAIFSFDNLFTRKPYNDELYFFYIKKFKDYDISNFNKAFSNIETYFTSKNKEVKLVNKSIAIWKDELTKLDLNEKKQKKLYLKGLKNIIKSFYVLNQIDSTVFYAKKYKEFKKSDKGMDYYAGLKIKYNVPKMMSYEPIPNNLKIALRYHNKRNDVINNIICGSTINMKNYFHLLLTSKLTKKNAKSLYSTKNIFISIHQASYIKPIKKQNKEVYDKMKQYRKETKALWSSRDYSRFFSTHSFDELSKIYDNELIMSVFNKQYAKVDIKRRDLVLSLFNYYYQLHIIKNNNLDINEYLKLKPILVAQLKSYISSSKKPIEEVVNEVLNDLTLTDSPQKIINLSRKQMQTLQKNFIATCSLIIPY